MAEPRPARITLSLPATGSSETSAPVDSKSFREGMAHLPSAVNIITSIEDGVPFGFTASAVSSVSDSPPTLLVCVNRNTQSHPVIRRSGVLCVNTLGSQHRDLSMVFAGADGNKDMAARFAHAEWTTGITGAPVLADAVTAFDCRVVAIAEAGTHDVFFCEVLNVSRTQPSQGLVYLDRKFHHIALS